MCRSHEKGNLRFCAASTRNTEPQRQAAQLRAPQPRSARATHRVRVLAADGVDWDNRTIGSWQIEHVCLTCRNLTIFNAHQAANSATFARHTCPGPRDGRVGWISRRMGVVTITLHETGAQLLHWPFATESSRASRRRGGRL